MPIYIAHRGNIHGPEGCENNPRYITKRLSDYSWLHCEVDVWFQNGEWYLGHDYPTYKINDVFLMNPRLWCHAKNLGALERMLKNTNTHCFWHEEDKFTITSKGYIWTYPNQPLVERSICVMPERYITAPLLAICAGVCSDFILV